MKKRAIVLGKTKPREIIFTKIKNEEKPKKEPKYSYFIAYIDKSGKVQNMLADFWYEINTRKNFKEFTRELNQQTMGNYRTIIFFKKLKFVNGEE